MLPKDQEEAAEAHLEAQASGQAAAAGEQYTREEVEEE